MLFNSVAIGHISLLIIFSMARQNDCFITWIIESHKI